MSPVPESPVVRSAWRRRLPLALTLFLLALGALLAWGWWSVGQRLDQTARELARRVTDQQAAMRDETARNRQLQETVRQMAAKYAVLESKLAESQSQQLALEQMYQSLSRGHEDTTLVEVEQMVGMAAQQLQLAGNVNSAVSALQAADARLARDGSPRLVPIRRAIGRDLERLRAVPNVDAPGIALKLEQVAAVVDRLPLMSTVGAPEVDGAGARQAAREAERAHAAAAEAPWWTRAWLRLLDLGSEFAKDASQLIRIRKVDTPEALLLAPGQAYFVRENLRLRLISARFALLARHEASFRADIRAARDVLTRYFDVQAKPVASALQTIKSLESADVAIELPGLTDTLAALRSARPAREAK